MVNNRKRIKGAAITKCSVCPVRGMSLYQHVPEEALETAQRFRQHQVFVSPKTTLYAAGTKPDFLYSIFDGWVALSQTTHAGKRQIIRFAFPGDFLGFQSCGDGNVMHSAVAITAATLCSYPRSHLKEMFNAQPPLLSNQLAIMSSQELGMCQQHLLSVGRKDAQGSVAFLLLELFHRSKTQIPKSYNPDNNAIVFPITQEDMGDAVGLTNVHVNRVIRQFIADGLIQCGNRELVILDEDKLSAIGEFKRGMIYGDALI